MEKLSTIQKRNNLNEVYRIGDVGPGGAYHDYCITLDESSKWFDIPDEEVYIHFQKGARNVKYGIVSLGGVIDEGYIGSIKVKLYNTTRVPYYFHAGDKIAQLVIQPYIAPDLEVVDELTELDGLFLTCWCR